MTEPVVESVALFIKKPSGFHIQESCDIITGLYGLPITSVAVDLVPSIGIPEEI